MNRIPKGWKQEKIIDVISSIPISKNKVKQNEYLDEGLLPIIDQGKEFIGGYTNKIERKVTCNLPVIVFGDHTKIIKYVDFDFVTGADGVKVIKPKDDFIPKLFYYFLQNIRLPNKGYARHFQYLKKSEINIPPKKFQRDLIEILDRSVKLQEKIQNSKNLARNLTLSVFIKMFGNPIENPNKFEIKPLKEIIKDTKFGTSTKCTFSKTKYPVLRIPNVIDGSINFENLKYTNNKNEFSKAELKKGDILMVRSNGNRNYVGRCSVFDSKEKMAFASYLIRIRVNDQILPEFLTSFFQTNMGRSLLLSKSRPTAGQFNINSTNFKKIKMFVPNIKLQEKFVIKKMQIEEFIKKINYLNMNIDLFSKSLISKAYNGELTLNNFK